MSSPGTNVQNNCWLDPLYRIRYSRFGGYWRANQNPTTCFRHGSGKTNAVCADGHAESYALGGGVLTTNEPRWRIGHVGAGNAPHYVPDWEDWGPLPTIPAF